MSDIPTQAAEWLVKLSSEDPAPTTADFAEFERWKNTDSRHRTAAASMEALLGNLSALPPQPAAAALDHAHRSGNSDSSWSGLAKTLCVLLVLFLPLWFYYWEAPAVLIADRKTSTGEWQEIRLPDSSRLLLSSNSAVNIEFNQQQRLIELISGEILIDVAHDKQRALVVETPQGDFTALGTRFTVKHRDESRSVLTVIESKVKACTTADAAVDCGVVVEQNQRIRLDQNGYGSIESVDAASYEQAWHARQLVVEGLPLNDVLDQLSPFYPGHLSYDAAELAQHRVYAVLPLDEPKRALQLLSESLPIELTEFTPWFVQINKK